MSRILLIDDLRDLPSDRIARNFADGIYALQNDGPWDELLLDHDLASWDADHRERTGYHIVLFLEANPEFRPRFVRLVTGNPVGRDNMARALEAMGYSALRDSAGRKGYLFGLE